MTAQRIMVQGTGSYVGKSVLTAALCRYFHRLGYRVAPFKAQNMSNNSYVTADGGEIGRAQAFQAACCGIEPSVEMNPVLLKPASETGSQVVVLGKPVGHMRACEYHEYQHKLKATVEAAFDKLAMEHDIVVIEGAGSPAEINLRKFDIANMFVARMTKAPVLLVGDIHVGGVFASLVGTLALLSQKERGLVKGFVINKFRGDVNLLGDGIKMLERRTRKKVIGVIPFVPDLPVEEEDGAGDHRPQMARAFAEDKLNIAVVRLPRISNSTDFEKLAQEPDVALCYVTKPAAGSIRPDVVIIPGTKSTISDLEFLRASGLAAWLDGLRAQGVSIVGICGGFQMLGTRILDPAQVESSTTDMPGLGFLPLTTQFKTKKTTVRVRGTTVSSSSEIAGYEIHMGITNASPELRPVFHITEQGGTAVDQYDGCMTHDGLVWGTYVHGVFDAPGFRREFLNQLRRRRNWPALPPQKIHTSTNNFDMLADLVTNHLDCEFIKSCLAQD